jgi:hypothetical protein
VRKHYEDLVVSAMGAIVDHFHGPYWMASEEAATSCLIGKEIPRRSIESLPTNGTGYVSNAFGANPIPIHRPENGEIFAALSTGGDKSVVHRALSLPDFSAR